MAKSKLEELQLQMEKVSSPLEARRVNYLKTLKKVRLQLCSYFFNEVNQDLHERTASGQQWFDWESIKPGMENCLPEEQVLAGRADKLQSESSDKISITDALDYQVTQSGLLLKRVNTGYEFQPEKPYTPKAQLFMQQFAGALSIYRVYLGIYEIYCCNYPFSKVDSHKGCLEKATGIHKETQQSQYDAAQLFHEAKDNARVIKTLLVSIREGQEEFDHAMKLQAAHLANQFELAARVIEDCYKKHPNSSLLFFAKDSEWQRLLKGIAADLFDNQFTYSSLAGTLTILPTFMETVIAEITAFYMAVCENQIDYRGELLRSALCLTSEVITKLRVDAAIKDVSLDIQMPAPESKPSDFPSLYALYGLRFNSPAKQIQEESDLSPYSFSQQ
ncbi:hypothetical protein DIZ81_03260 [Legionella taurinensis]|uniref:Coiled-coil protein n=1 Tax=Legionella taurinensis TaxID=70611 RepID=A0A3A5L6H5_9GAMM|nr:hypothetical protein [Legionella taurinensis]MDX1836107.1 hypothetical protein [Legionella taurinensis]PUT42119.1 hypothetical protein DB744_03260 [Legionella taurinensis]PUT44906.1 hypothetical protein DB746_03260 [Legionella taurinensis]PUT48228.1 hypothetical protein DB743_01425 [Legionella taurinensis]PUT49041.1 hypothetical protein DB745_03260 [Legionella taurinensis]